MRKQSVAIAGLGTVVLALLLLRVLFTKSHKAEPAPAITTTLVTDAPEAGAIDGADAPAYDGDFCRAMVAASHFATTKASKLYGKKIDPPLPDPSCIDGDRGGWALRIDDSIVVPKESGAGNDVGWKVVLVHRDTHSGLGIYDLPSDTWRPDGGLELAVSATFLSDYGSRFFGELVVGNIDGDADPEVFVSGGVNEEGPDEGWTRLLTFSGGRIQNYAPAKDIDVQSAKDLDGDGRLDLLTPGAYSGVQTASALSGSTHPVLGGVFVAHAQRDGTFSMTDAFAKATLLARCPKRAPLVFPPDWVDATEGSEQILCARAWGASEADVKRELSKRCAGWDHVPTDATHCPNALLEAAKIVPDVTLP